eukprot:5130039-Prymnesium_polylepis.2
MLPAMWASNKVDWTKEGPQTALLASFAIVVLAGWTMLQYTLRVIHKKGDTGRVADPGDGPSMPAKAEDGTISVCEYDVAKVKELKMQFMMSVGITTFLHIKCAPPPRPPRPRSRAPQPTARPSPFPRAGGPTRSRSSSSA